VNIINIVICLHSPEQVTFQGYEIIPSHMGYLVGRRKEAYICVEDAEARGISFLTKPAHELQAKADAKDRLFKGPDDSIKISLFKIAMADPASPTPGIMTLPAASSSAGLLVMMLR
jgi:hypothetical protein